MSAAFGQSVCKEGGQPNGGSIFFAYRTQTADESGFRCYKEVHEMKTAQIADIAEVWNAFFVYTVTVNFTKMYYPLIAISILWLNIYSIKFHRSSKMQGGN